MAEREWLPLPEPWDQPPGEMVMGSCERVFLDADLIEQCDQHDATRVRAGFGA